MAIQWPLLIFSLLAGCGGVTLASAGVAELLGVAKKTRFVAVVVALVLLIVGGCASVLHLAQPANIMAAAANIFSFSGISVELIMLGLNVIVGAIYLVLVGRGGSASASKAVGVIGIVVGIVMAFVVGNGYVMEAQPLWNTPLLPVAYLGSGLACGATLFASLMVARGEEAADIAKFAPVALAATVIEAVAFLAYGAVIGFACDAAVYWGGAIVVGCAGAIACAVVARKTPAAWYGSCACALVGGIAIRAVMWMIGTGFIAGFATAASRTVLGV